MDESKTTVRNLKILMQLTSPGGVSVSSLAEKFDVHPRTIQRLIAMFREAGYVIEKYGERYKINRRETKREAKFDIGDLLYFSKEEAWMLDTAIKNLPGNNGVKEKLIKKLYSLYSAESVAKNIVKQEESEQFNVIHEAIVNKFQIEMVEYSVATTNRHLKSVIVEPIEFADSFSRVWAYYPQRNKNLLIRLSGIHGVKPLYKLQQFTQYHKVGFIDLFRGYGFEKIPLRLNLNRRAYGFLIDEFPMSQSMLKPMKDDEIYGFELNTEICHYAHVARFCLGLPGDIEILEPLELIDYMEGRRREKRFDEFGCFNPVSHGGGETVQIKKSDSV